MELQQELRHPEVGLIENVLPSAGFKPVQGTSPKEAYCQVSILGKAGNILCQDVTLTTTLCKSTLNYAHYSSFQLYTI